MERIHWIDWIKALGILLVVVGHTPLPTIFPPTGIWISSFHMPLFFVISGFHFSEGSFDQPWKIFFQRRLKKLLLGYFFFSLLGSIHYILLSQVGDTTLLLSEVFRDRLFSMAYGSGTVEGSWTLYPLVLWFFPALITGILSLYGIRRFLPPRHALLAILLLTLGTFALRRVALPWEIESGMAAALFIQSGHYLRLNARWQQVLADMRPSVITLLFITGSFIGFLSNGMDFRTSNFGNPIFSYSGCALILIAFIALSMRLPPRPEAEALSAATVLIFPVHLLVFWLVDLSAIHLGCLTEEPGMTSPVYVLFKIGLTLGILLLFFPLFRRMFPWLTSSRRAGHSALPNMPVPQPDLARVAAQK